VMNVQDYAERLLLGLSLKDKLLHPESLDWKTRGRAWTAIPEQPGRPPELTLAESSRRRPFPTQRELEREQARGVVLHFFANHELLAIEIMALTLLRFPEAPLSFRQGLVRTIIEEQGHLSSYLQRMGELGVEFGEVPMNGFFWDCLKEMRNPLDFVLGMSLTFEQANLDFARYYRNIFAHLGDKVTAAIMDRVYEDEIGHVKHGVKWLEYWKEPEETQWQAYSQHLRLPLSPARAKGPIFDREARRRADLTKEFSEQLQVYAGTKGRVPNLFWYNADCELELSREGPGYSPQQGMRKVMGELMSCLMYVARPGDVVLTQKLPSSAYLSQLQELGFELPEFCVLPDQPQAAQALLKSRRWDRFYPWGWTPRSLELVNCVKSADAGTSLPIDLATDDFWQSPWMQLFRKSALPRLRQELREELEGADDDLWGPQEADGALVGDLTDVLVAISQMHAAFGTPAVIKSPYGFAGSGMLRAYPGQDLSEAQLGWIERQLDLYGAVLIEPWLKRVADFSVVWSEESEALHPFVFFTNAKGQYKGHSLQPFAYALSPDQRRFLFETRRSPVAAYEQLLLVAGAIRQKLQQHGYRYAAGIDTMLYEWKGQWHLRVLGEVNCRMTMGHVARGLRKRVSPGQASIWQSVSVLEAQTRGWTSLQAMAKDLQAQHPPMMKGELVDRGIFFTNDPSQSLYVLGVVAVGPAAIAACDGLGAQSPG